MACGPKRSKQPVDYSQAGGAKGYLERIGVLAADRGPGPAFVPRDRLVNQIPLSAPLPPAPLAGHLLGENPPDRGQTFSWPRPEVPG